MSWLYYAIWLCVFFALWLTIAKKPEHLWMEDDRDRPDPWSSTHFLGASYLTYLLVSKGLDWAFGFGFSAAVVILLGFLYELVIDGILAKRLGFRWGDFRGASRLDMAMDVAGVIGAYVLWVI